MRYKKKNILIFWPLYSRLHARVASSPNSCSRARHPYKETTTTGKNHKLINNKKNKQWQWFLRDQLRVCVCFCHLLAGHWCVVRSKTSPLFFLSPSFLWCLRQPTFGRRKKNEEEEEEKDDQICKDYRKNGKLATRNKKSNQTI
jgi:hypothetical protein